MKKIIIILFLFSVFILGFFPARDTDFGWHYRCGNQFLTTGKLCLTNEFSYFLPNYKAYYTGHLYDIILAFFYNHGGFISISLLGGLIYLLSALVFLYLIRADLIIKIIAFFSVFFLSYSIFNLGLRPQIISFLFFLILLLILSQKKQKLLYILPFLFFIWVNIHIGFFVGLITLFIYTFDKFLRLLLDRIRDVILLFSICFFSFIATLINPFGIFVYKEILNHAFSPLNTMIAEWVPPTTPYVILIIISGIIGLITLVRKKPFSLYQVFLLIFFGALALSARRNVSFYYVIASYVLLNGTKFNTDRFFSLFLPLLATLALFVAIIQIPQTIDYSISWHSYCNESITYTYPCEAIKKFPKLSGNVFSLYEWGGFLIWQKPNIKVFVDGRMPAWKDENGKSPYQVYLDIIQTKNGWNEKLRSLKTDYIFITNGTFLDLLLQKESQKYHWKEVYRDNLAVIYQNTI